MRGGEALGCVRAAKGGEEGGNEKTDSPCAALRLSAALDYGGWRGG